jgi:hypothetical protein
MDIDSNKIYRGNKIAKDLINQNIVWIEYQRYNHKYIGKMMKTDYKKFMRNTE